MGLKDDEKGFYYKLEIIVCLLVHRLMAETFLENPNNYEEVDHIDRNRSNNVI